MQNVRSAANRPRGRLSRYAVALSARANYMRALKWPSQIPYIMLTEFPRSGGNWIRDMMGDALQLPVPRFSRFPITFAAIAHNHDHRLLSNGDAIYVLRDGRDVFMSHLDKTIYAFVDGTPALRRRLLRIHPSLKVLDKDKAAREDVDMEKFYAEWKVRPMGSRVNWGRHVAPWIDCTSSRLVRIRYEDMRSVPETTLARAVSRFSDTAVPEETVRFAVERNSFRAQTGRDPGQIEASSTKRQGIAGAWKSQMPTEIVALFHNDFGKVLEQAGYDV